MLDPDESAGRAYYTRFVPAGLRALRRAVDGIAAGMVCCKRRDEVEQVDCTLTMHTVRHMHSMEQRRAPGSSRLRHGEIQRALASATLRSQN